MTQTIKFIFEGFEIEAKFSKDDEPPYDSWELYEWKLLNGEATYFVARKLGITVNSADERIEAACYEALENYDINDYINEE
jgi:hypothetical protein